MLRPWLYATLLAVAACAPQSGSPVEDARFLVFFDEFSANLTPDAIRVVADAVKRAHEISARAIRIEARASATGSPTANQYLAQTRAQVVADELAKDGIARAMLHQVPIGQTGSGDPTVAERRVDLILER